MRSNILLIQPDGEQSAALRNLLESHGHRVIESPSLDNASAVVTRTRPDAVIVHWSDRFTASEFLESVLRVNGQNATAIITACDAELNDALTALEMGYDECIRFPVSDAELLARLDASMRRKTIDGSAAVIVGRLVLDKRFHCLCINGKQVTLAPTEYRLMQFFIENPGRVFSRDELLKRAWRKNIMAESRTVDVHIRRLRKLLEPYNCDNMLQTVHGFGYRFSKIADPT